MITQWFNPEPIFKGLFFAKELQNQGHEVEVITGFPNYPGGKVYAGYKIKAYQQEIIDGIRVHRIPIYPSHDNSALKRVLNYSSFFFSSFFFGLFKARKFDVIYAYHPPLTTSLSSVILGKLCRTPTVIDIQDLWPDTLKATGMLNNEKVLSVVSWFCKLTYKLANHIVVLSPGFKSELIQREVSNKKISVIYNWCDENALTPKGSCNYKLPEYGFNVLFAGNIGRAQGVDAIIDAAVILKHKKSIANIVFVGDGVSLEKAQKKVADFNLTNVHFIPRVPMEDVSDLLSNADALLVHLNDEILFEITIPSRTQAYMAMGKPIIMGVNGDAKKLIEQSQCGLCVPANNSQKLAGSIDLMSKLSKKELAVLGSNAKAFYDEQMSVKVGAKHFIDVFKKVINNA